jgi:hypothetical protein
VSFVGSGGFRWFPIGSGEVSVRLSLNLVSMCFGGDPMGFVGSGGSRRVQVVPDSQLFSCNVG